MSEKSTWRDVATWIALAGVLVTLVFNTVGVFLSVNEEKRQAREAASSAQFARLSRLDTQFGMLSSLSGLLNRNNVDLAVIRVCSGTKPPSRRVTHKVLSAAANYDYLAWLFNQKAWTSRAAERYWQANAAYVFQLVQRVSRTTYVRRQFRELVRFNRSIPLRVKTRAVSKLPC